MAIVNAVLWRRLWIFVGILSVRVKHFKFDTLRATPCRTVVQQSKPSHIQNKVA